MSSCKANVLSFSLQAMLIRQAFHFLGIVREEVRLTRDQGECISIVSRLRQVIELLFYFY